VTLLDRVDWGDAGLGAALILAVLGPPVLIVNVLAGGDDSNLWIVPALAIFAAFALGGWVAARRQPGTPFVHAAAAAVLALVAVRIVRTAVDLVQGDGVSFPLTFVLLAQIAVSVAVLGAYAAVRGRRA